ncbi:hypothetical protein PFICI_11058 [Pestalotiopsis fici W106-1]|uniref:Ecp2 effector protein domain-containing protein n=1 Tax=Pestalotiopsis fici (strain W106-1 / CGMCC3.15140) TaxID=1229662 RepID=W3WTP4_PESFW|nr:uncharacterized protein PFICI_11058 [Pestalotiopsis fici W106-1]ETS77184.1 hypothetical protein PFICI_11058 [Pestalotiopsis fici W106-1]
MRFTTTLVGLFALGSATAAHLRLPEGLPDGHYSGDGTIDPKTGFARYKYLGPIDEYALRNRTLESRNEERIGSRDSWNGIKCNGRGAGDSVSIAQQAFAAHFDGYTFSNKWVKTFKGSTQAFACNYGGVQTVHRSDFEDRMGGVDSICGSGQAGWYEDHEWKLNYGRDFINSQVC